MVFIWKLLIRPFGGYFDIYELFPAFVLSCLVIVIVSLFTKKPSQEIQDEFDYVKTTNIKKQQNRDCIIRFIGLIDHKCQIDGIYRYNLAFVM